MNNSNLQENKLILYLVIVSDVVLMIFALYIDISIVYGKKNVVDFGIGIIKMIYFSNFYILFVLVILLSLIFFKIYNVYDYKVNSYQETLLSIVLSVLLINIICSFFTRLCSFMPCITYSMFISNCLIQVILLSIWKKILHKIMPKISKTKETMFILEKNNLDELYLNIYNKCNKKFNIKYIFDIDEEKREIEDKIDEVKIVFVAKEISSETKNWLINLCVKYNKELYLAPSIVDILFQNVQIVNINSIPIFKIPSFSISREAEMLKRIFDIVCSSILIVLTLPIMSLIFILIKIFDRGSAIYTQERLTKNNKIFRIYKFRTMIECAEKATGPVLCNQNDNRITPIGSFLRATRLDELPQFFNVLKGDMSMVGPRPERQHFVDKYTEEIPSFKYRLVVKAGVTGLAQVLGKYTTSPNDKLMFDLIYVKNCSVLFDIKIIMITIKIMFMKSSSIGLNNSQKIGSSENL